MAPDLIEILMSTYLRLRYPTVPVFLSSLPKRGLKYLSFLKFVLEFLVVDSLCLYFYSFKNLWLDMKSLCSVSNSTVINILSTRFLFFKKRQEGTRNSCPLHLGNIELDKLVTHQ